MTKDRSFHDYVVCDLLAEISGITSRAMFGGWGIYKDGIIFGIIIDGALYFKVSDQNRADFEQRGSHPFIYTDRHKKSITLSYWLVPDALLEDRGILAEWVKRAVNVSSTGAPATAQQRAYDGHRRTP